MKHQTGSCVFFCGKKEDVSMTLKGPVLRPFLEIRAASLAANHPKIKTENTSVRIHSPLFTAARKKKKTLGFSAYFRAYGRRRETRGEALGDRRRRRGWICFRARGNTFLTSFTPASFWGLKFGHVCTFSRVPTVACVTCRFRGICCCSNSGSSVSVCDVNNHNGGLRTETRSRRRSWRNRFNKPAVALRKKSVIDSLNLFNQAVQT